MVKFNNKEHVTTWEAGTNNINKITIKTMCMPSFLRGLPYPSNSPANWCGLRGWTKRNALQGPVALSCQELYGRWTNIRLK